MALIAKTIVAVIVRTKIVQVLMLTPILVPILIVILAIRLITTVVIHETHVRHSYLLFIPTSHQGRGYWERGSSLS